MLRSHIGSMWLNRKFGFVEANENTSSETEETNSINIDALEGIDFFKEEGRESQNI